MTLSSQEWRDRVFERLGHLSAALGSPGRLRIIQLLAQRPHTVEELSAATLQSVANTSQHLRRLAAAGVVASRKQGLYRIYSIRDASVLEAWEAIQDLGRALLPELRECEDRLTDPSLQSPLPADEALRLVQSGKALLLDVRDARESESSPVSGSLRIPLPELRAELGSLPRSRRIFVFCRGRFCPLASEAVRQLRSHGYRAFRLQESQFRLNRLQQRSSS